MRGKGQQLFVTEACADVLASGGVGAKVAATTAARATR